MATAITINTTNAHDAVIQRIIDKENIARTAQNVILAAQTPPGTPLAMYTITSYITSILVEAFKGWKTQQAAEDTDGLKAAWEAANATQRTNARTALGL